MKTNLWLIWVLSLTFAWLVGCQKETVSVGPNVRDYFYLENQGAKMPVLVEGNTASGTMVVWVHGGPGGTAIGFQNDENSTKYLETNFGVAYWDQRAAGGSQGSNTPPLALNQYADDLKKLVQLLKYRYGSQTKIFLLSHSWGGLVAPAFLTEGTNQQLVRGWIDVAGAHNYYANDSLTRAYLFQFGTDQISKNIHTAEWQPIVDYCQTHVPNYDLTVSRALNACADQAEGYIDDIQKNSGTGIGNLFSTSKTAFSLFWFASNAGATYFADLNKGVLHAEYSSKLSRLTLPILCITGKYDFTVPRGLADEVMQKTASTRKKLVILPHSGHICMDNEPIPFYEAVVEFIRLN
jgi:pimeloyl-ACP methyl ester carboxylesterase